MSNPISIKTIYKVSLITKRKIQSVKLKDVFIVSEIWSEQEVYEKHYELSGPVFTKKIVPVITATLCVLHAAEKEK